MSKDPKDLEIGNGTALTAASLPPPPPPPVLYPKMLEDPRLRWAFIRKVYAVLSAQFLFTAAVASIAYFVRPIPAFFLSHTPASWAVFTLILISPFIAMVPMLLYRERHPVNLVFLAFYTFCMSCSVGLSCAFATIGGKIILEAIILTSTVAVGLTLFTFWAARRGYDFNFLCPFLFASLLIMLTYLTIQLFFPLEKTLYTIYSLFATIVFSGCIVHDTDNLIKCHSYDQYVVAAIHLYMDIINLFMTMVGFAGISH